MRKQSTSWSLFIGLVAASQVVTPVSSFLSLSTRSTSRRSHDCELRASSAEWSASDDWTFLSSESDRVDTAAIFNTDISGAAAKALEQEADEAASDLAAAAAINASPVATLEADPDDAMVADAIETIQNSIDPSDPPLYDSLSSFATYEASDDAAEKAAKEIGLLVRCNESPNHMLVSEGRALPPLTDEERYDSLQMVRLADDGTSYETTHFFDLAVMQMFHEHATSDNEDEVVMDAAGIASWLTKSLGDETYIAVGPHSKEVGSIIAQYGSYGSGVIKEAQFHQIYFDAIVNAINARDERLPQQNGDPNMTTPTVESLWRDFRNHGILPPAEEERKRLQAELDAEYGSSQMTVGSESAVDTLFDECEILEWGENESNGHGATDVTKSSHKFVELTFDNKTPKRIRDGDFVFIDEESCIGCMQCATVAPSTFTMLENGRARTYQQGSGPEIKSAVASCPVSCMHYVGFQELQKFENARDNGDGRDDHRHFGGRNTHIPLNVAGIDSDANRKSSWYHYLRHKCFISKKSCPTNGCYDCPNFSSPGMNPYFKERHRKAERARARDLIESGEADLWRKQVEL